MKKAATLLITIAAALSMTACGGAQKAADAAVPPQGRYFNIYTWNDEFKGWFEKYYTPPKGVVVNWIITPDEGGGYQERLDEVLPGNEQADASDKVDLIVAEADYVLKYVRSDLTTDVREFGVTDFSNAYPYTVKASTDADGAIKGVGIQCCPSAMIYRRSIARDVLGTDDPLRVQEFVSSWEKFDEVAARAKEKGYYMTASDGETYRAFANNTSVPWVNDKNELQIAPEIRAWIDQAEKYSQNGYTINADIWDDVTKDQMFADGKTLCFFGPAWYFLFGMGNAHSSPENPNGCDGDWAICEGPAAHFWGGTWLLAASGTDNGEMVADVMNAFINNEEICSQLVEKEAQFSNNQAVNNRFAADPDYGSEFLGGQNDAAVFAELAKDIKFENRTIYDQICNEKIQGNMRDYFEGIVDKDTAMRLFYKAIKEAYPDVSVPGV